MADFVKIARTDDVPVGKAKIYDVDGRQIALCNVDGAFYAIDDECTHDGGPLGEGELEGDTVTCPWHGWQYNVKTGACLGKDGIKVACYDVKVEGGDITIALP